MSVNSWVIRIWSLEMGDSALDNALYQYMLCLPSYWMVSSWEKLTGVQLSMCSSKTTFTPCKISSASASCQHLEGETILSKLTSTLLYTHTPKVTYLLSVRYLCHRKKKLPTFRQWKKIPNRWPKTPSKGQSESRWTFLHLHRLDGHLWSQQYFIATLKK